MAGQERKDDRQLVLDGLVLPGPGRSTYLFPPEEVSKARPPGLSPQAPDIKDASEDGRWELFTLGLLAAEDLPITQAALDQAPTYGRGEIRTRRPSWIKTDQGWDYLRERTDDGGCRYSEEARWFVLNSTAFPLVKGLIDFGEGFDEGLQEEFVVHVMTGWRLELDQMMGVEKARRLTRQLHGMSVGRRLRRDKGYRSEPPGTERGYGETAHETLFAYEHDYYYEDGLNGVIETMSELDLWFLRSLCQRTDLAKIREYDSEKERKWWTFKRRLECPEPMPSYLGAEDMDGWLRLPPWKQNFLLSGEGESFWKTHDHLFGQNDTEALAVFATSGMRGIAHEQFRHAGEITREWGLGFHRALALRHNGLDEKLDGCTELMALVQEHWGAEQVELEKANEGTTLSLAATKRVFRVFYDCVQAAVDRANGPPPLDPQPPLPIEKLVDLLRTVYGIEIGFDVQENPEVIRIANALIIAVRRLGGENKRDGRVHLPEVLVGEGYQADLLVIPPDLGTYGNVQVALKQSLAMMDAADGEEKRGFPKLGEIFGDLVKDGRERGELIFKEMKIRTSSRPNPARSPSVCLGSLQAAAHSCQKLGLDKRFDLRFLLVQVTPFEDVVNEYSYKELLEEETAL